MQPNRYTELFFLDEATALAAGHRPCFECRRADAERFAELWSEGAWPAQPARAPRWTQILHAERTGPRGAKRTHIARDSPACRTAPSCCMPPTVPRRMPISLTRIGFWRGRRHGYQTAMLAARAGAIEVLTPPPSLPYFPPDIVPCCIRPPRAGLLG